MDEAEVEDDDSHAPSKHDGGEDGGGSGSEGGSVGVGEGGGGIGAADGPLPLIHFSTVDAARNAGFFPLSPDNTLVAFSVRRTLFARCGLEGRELRCLSRRPCYRDMLLWERVSNSEEKEEGEGVRYQLGC